MHRVIAGACAALVALILLALPSARTAAPPSPSPTGQPFRLDKRVPLMGSRVAGWPDPPPPYRTRRVFEGIALRQPLYLSSDPVHPGVFIVEQAGRVLYVAPGAARAQPFCTIGDHDTYSLTFHPKYRTNGLVYVFSNGPNSAGPKKKNRIYRFHAKGEPPVCDPASRHLVIEWASNGHNGGDLLFGPDGYLYITSGDGTSDSDGDNTGQDLRDLCSGILRLDVDRPTPGKGYSVPRDNPFLAVKGARPQLYAFGLRNPWRMSIDRASNDVYIGDVGQDLWEMIYLLRRGANYGWSAYEGSHPFHKHRKLGPAPLVRPLIEHPHSESRSITGGQVYRGARFKDLQGAYVYADYSTGKVWGLRQVAGKVTWRKDLAATRLQTVAIGQDRAGELYLVDYTGQIHQFEPAPPPVAAAPFPRKLSESGLFASVAGHVVQPGVVPYSVNSPLWSDRAFKERFFALLGAGRIGFTEEGAWGFPEGTVLIKTFSLDMEEGRPSSRKRIETRFLTFQQGEWYGYSYAWNDAQTDADLVETGGRDRKFAIEDGKVAGGTRAQTWHYPSRVECMVCHTRAAAYVLGLNTAQMNRAHDYGGGAVVNQLRALDGLSMFRAPLADNFKGRKEKVFQDLRRRDPAHLPRPIEGLARLADPSDRKADLGARARSYLQANCAHCHVEAGGGNSAIDLHVNRPLNKMRLVGVPPLHDRFGIANALLVAPGEPQRSMLYQRVGRLGAGRMPPVGSALVDDEGLGLLEAWIRGLPSKRP